MEGANDGLSPGPVQHFTVRGVDQQGKSVKFDVLATSENEAIEVAKARGVFATDIRIASVSAVPISMPPEIRTNLREVARHQRSLVGTFLITNVVAIPYMRMTPKNGGADDLIFAASAMLTWVGVVALVVFAVKLHASMNGTGFPTIMVLAGLFIPIVNFLVLASLWFSANEHLRHHGVQVRYLWIDPKRI